MTRPEDTKRDDERELEELLGEAFAHAGELPPTTEDEVERAEREGVEHTGELPESLRELSPARPPARVVRLDDERRRRFPWLSHLAAAAVGAAAAAALVSIWKHEREPVRGAASSEPPAPRQDAAPRQKIAVGPVRGCTSPCCAGSECAAASGELRECSSGRRCVGCTLEQLADERYRIRLSSLAPGDAARQLLERGGTALELCVQVGSSDTTCVPAHASADGQEQWSTLPLVASAQDLLAGFVLEVRARGAAKPLARWHSPVRINPTLLCKGLFVKPKTDKGETFGVVSAFLDDTHYVEIARSDNLVRLEERGEALKLADVTPRISETTAKGRDRFVLAIGPLSKREAEMLRWELLRQGQEARLGIGQDLVGAPRELR